MAFFVAISKETQKAMTGLQVVDFKKAEKNRRQACARDMSNKRFRTIGRITSALPLQASKLEPIPKGWDLETYDEEKIDATAFDTELQNGVEEVDQAAPKAPLMLKKVDFHIGENAKEHFTDEYELTHPEEDSEYQPQLVIRRGFTFHVTLQFNRIPETEIDDITVLLSVGDTPKTSKSTLVTLILGDCPIKPPRSWTVKVVETDEENASLTLAIKSSPDSIIGKWNFRVETRTCIPANEDEDEDEVVPKERLKRYDHSQPIYLLFNPWCKDDQVYMEDEGMIDEYVMNDTGKIYTGNYKQVQAKPWNFGQFEDFILDCCFFLLDKCQLNANVRNNAVHLCRAISAVVTSDFKSKQVNSNDEDGVLEGNWSGDYKEGCSPTAWVGSVGILEEYWKTKIPVKFGQCWVFSGVVVTVCRALGLPARSITNFSSAHDCDGSITVDVHWDENQDPIEDLNEDSVWNFHVWNEAWMARPDLPPGYGGWQAFDATPQETSGGVYCAGPASVKAVKEGLVNLPYDGQFIFAEVNADKCHWIQEPDRSWRTVLQKYKIGKRISTKRPRMLADKDDDIYDHIFKDDPDRLDVTENYKFKEGTEMERASVYRANLQSSKPGLYKQAKEDVRFELNQLDNILVGNSFDVRLSVQNKSREVRTVTATVTLSSVFYTGVMKSKVKSQTFKRTLNAIKGSECVMRVSHEEYLHLLVDQVSFRISVLASVEETNQVFADCDDFRLRRPDLVVEGPTVAHVGVPFECMVKFENSMPVHLTNCEWQVEGPGIQRTKKLPEKDLEPYDRKNIVVSLTPKRAGKRQILASFNSKELMDVTGVFDIIIKP